MARDLHAIGRRRSALLVRHVVLVAVLAIGSSSLLPIAHGASSHSGDCGVCSLITSAGASVGVPGSDPDLARVEPGPELAQHGIDVVLSRPGLDAHPERGPPPALVIA